MAIVNGYCSLPELRDRLGITDDNGDAALEAVIEVVSRWIEGKCGRRFYTTATDETRYYTARAYDHLLTDDILSVTTLATDDNGDRLYSAVWATMDYELTPPNAALNGEPYTGLEITPVGNYGFLAGLRRGVKIVGKFGYSSTTPAKVREACLLRASQLWMLRQGPLGQIAGGEFAVPTSTVPYAVILDLLQEFMPVSVG